MDNVFYARANAWNNISSTWTSIAANTTQKPRLKSVKSYILCIKRKNILKKYTAL